MTVRFRLVTALEFDPGTARRESAQRVLSIYNEECSADCHIGFGTIFSDADVSIGSGVYIGHYCSIGEVTIEKDVLIASHVSIMNGSHQHGTVELDVPIRDQAGVYDQSPSAKDTWLGERAIVAASVGKHCIIGAGTLVLHSGAGLLRRGGCSRRNSARPAVGNGFRGSGWLRL